MRIHSQDDPEPRGRRPHKPPPNYFSRRVQWKIFLLVGALMLVVIAMQEAKNPKYYRIFEKLRQGEIALPSNEPDVDTRLRPPESPEMDSELVAPIIRTSDTDSSSPDERNASLGNKATEESPSLSDPLDPLTEADHDAWSTVLEGLVDDQRDRLLIGLKTARDKKTLAADDRSDWLDAVSAADILWQAYLARATQAIDQDDGKLTEIERQSWRDVIAQLRTRWVEQAKPALDTVARDQPVDEENRQILQRVQASLDGVFLDDIRDNTVHRIQEKDAWFRLLEKLHRRSLIELENDSVGTVGFLSLYRQPAEYRGKLVTIQGSVRQGKHSPSPRNFYGIDGYSILWLKPTGSNSPIVVYCLELPEGFPLAEADASRNEPAEMDELVEVTGYFFKRWAYRAQDSTRLAPLLLAKTLRWERPADSQTQASDLPTVSVWTMMLGGTLIFGVGFAVVVYLYTRPRAAVVQYPRGSTTGKNDGDVVEPVSAKPEQAPKIQI